MRVPIRTGSVRATVGNGLGALDHRLAADFAVSDVFAGSTQWSRGELHLATRAVRATPDGAEAATSGLEADLPALRTSYRDRLKVVE